MISLPMRISPITPHRSYKIVRIDDKAEQVKGGLLIDTNLLTADFNLYHAARPVYVDADAERSYAGAEDSSPLS